MNFNSHLSFVSEGCGRISLSSALLLFKCVHGEQFSLDTWNRFVSSRLTSYDDVSFDEIKLWLCEVPSGDLSNDDDFDNEREKLENQGGENLYEDWSVLEKLQVNRILVQMVFNLLIKHISNISAVVPMVFRNNFVASHVNLNRSYFMKKIFKPLKTILCSKVSRISLVLVVFSPWYLGNQ